MKLTKAEDRFGWISKKAFAQPLSKEREKALFEEQGMLSVPDVRDKYPKGGKGGTAKGRGYRDIIKEVAVQDLFETDDPRLRSWVSIESDKIGVIDGQEYVILSYNKPTKTKDGTILVIGPLVRDENGKFSSELSTLTPTVLPYGEYIDKIQVSPEKIKQNIDAINEDIKAHNEFLDRVDKRVQEGKGATVTILPLQLARAEESIRKRLQTLVNQKESIETGALKQREQSEAGMNALEQTYEEAKAGGGNVSPQDYAILLLERKFHSVATLEELRASIVNEVMPFNPQVNVLLRNFIMGVIEWQIQERQKEIAKNITQDVARAERKMDEADLPQMEERLYDKIAPIEKLKGTVRKTTEYYSPKSMISSDDFTINSIDRDHAELTSVLNALEQAKQTIIDLPTKGNEFLRGEGAVEITKMEDFMRATDIFLKRYVEPVTMDANDNGELDLNPKLLGNRGELGNSLIAVVLKQIRASIKAELDRIKEGRGPGPMIVQERVPVGAPAEVLEEPVANVVGKIQKMSALLWKAFEERMRIR